MNMAADRVLFIISGIVCAACGQRDTEICARHRQRCFGLYGKEAQRITGDLLVPGDTLIERQDALIALLAGLVENPEISPGVSESDLAVFRRMRDEVSAARACLEEVHEP